MKCMKIGRFLCLLLFAVLAGCAADPDEISPSLTFKGMPAITNTSSRDLSGTVEPGATVEVSVNTTATVEALTNAAGLWSVTIANLVPGGNAVTVTATDATGNSNTLSLMLTYEVVTLERFVTPTPATSQTIGGVLAPGAAVPAVTIDPVATVGTVTVTGDFWSCNLAGFVTGLNTVTVTHSDIKGLQQIATAAITFDGTAPLLTIDPLGDTTLELRPLFSGTKTEGVTVLVSLNGAVAIPAEMPTTTTWEFLPTVDLRGGKNSLVVTGTAVDRPTIVARSFIVLE